MCSSSPGHYFRTHMVAVPSELGAWIDLWCMHRSVVHTWLHVLCKHVSIRLGRIVLIRCSTVLFLLGTTTSRLSHSKRMHLYGLTTVQWRGVPLSPYWQVASKLNLFLNCSVFIPLSQDFVSYLNSDGLILPQGWVYVVSAIREICLFDDYSYIPRPLPSPACSILVWHSQTLAHARGGRSGVRT